VKYAASKPISTQAHYVDISFQRFATRLEIKLQLSVSVRVTTDIENPADSPDFLLDQSGLAPEKLYHLAPFLGFLGDE
jgi:hypothetical protein